MLYADKAALENRTKVKLLAIRERELNLYTTNCRTVGNVSALMAGIAYTALIYTKMAYFQESHVVQQLLYITGLVICMCLSLRNVLGTTLLTMLGPGKALRGPDGSMHAAVDGMKDAFETIATIQHLTIYRRAHPARVADQRSYRSGSADPPPCRSASRAAWARDARACMRVRVRERWGRDARLPTWTTAATLSGEWRRCARRPLACADRSRAPTARLAPAASWPRRSYIPGGRRRWRGGARSCCRSRSLRSPRA